MLEITILKILILTASKLIDATYRRTMKEQRDDNS
jgi:hypothetical protein